VPTAVADLSAAILTARLDKPLAATLLDQPEAVSLLPAGQGPASAGATAASRASTPVYGYPESAATALAHAVRYREWRDSQSGQVPDFRDIDIVAARALIGAFLTASPDGGWLGQADAAALLASYQIPMVATRTDAGGVETIVGVVQEPVFGPVVVFGLGGVATEVLGDHAARLAPLTDTDAAELIATVRAAPLLFGHRGSPAVDTAALADLLLRVSRLADDLPEVAELELNPVIARPDGVHIGDVRVRVAAAAPRDPFLRQLR
jgi:acyl-CoA synthetase (NDP forming)